MKAGDYCPVALRLPGLQSRRLGKAKPPPGSFPERTKAKKPASKAGFSNLAPLTGLELHLYSFLLTGL